MIMKIKNIGALFTVLCSLFIVNCYAATVVATVGGRAVTDADVTARVGLMTKQGNTSTNNRREALQNIIDDFVKLDYAANFNVKPSDADVVKQMSAMNLGELSSTQRAVAKNALTADIAWQMIVARTILPTIDVSNEEVASERNSIAREHGLPIEMTIVRLTNIPADIADKLTKPKSCDDAENIARNLGGVPQKFTAVQYELSADVRERVAALPRLTWSSRVDNSVLLVCDTKRTSEYGKLDDMIKQNAMYKKAMFIADQQLKQLRRKAVVVITDKKYEI